MSEENINIYGECPKCGGDDLLRNTRCVWLVDITQRIALEVDCENCGKTFEAIYEFIQYGEVLFEEE